MWVIDAIRPLLSNGAVGAGDGSLRYPKVMRRRRKRGETRSFGVPFYRQLTYISRRDGGKVTWAIVYSYMCMLSKGVMVFVRNLPYT